MTHQNFAAVIPLDAFRHGAEAQPQRQKRRRKPKHPGVRLWAKVDRTAGRSGCWPFTGSVFQANGYGQIRAHNHRTGTGSSRTAHAVAWEVANERPVPDGFMVLHAIGCCKTCCNPAHLRIGTHAENEADKIAEGRAGRRLTSSDARRIVHLHEDLGLGVLQLAKMYGFAPSTAQRILRGVTHVKDTGVARNFGVAGVRRSGGRNKLPRLAVPPAALVAMAS